MEKAKERKFYRIRAEKSTQLSRGNERGKFGGVVRAEDCSGRRAAAVWHDLPAALESFIEDASKEVEEAEIAIKEQLRRNPDNINALCSLLELKVEGRNIKRAIEVIDRLIMLEPEKFEWPLLKANMLLYNSDLQRNLPFRILAP
ncbi:hypothetical protein RJT34_16641 [Clitoria ternatea]|uniref:Uncharacterized protein n=1 Tax=Clitoria ternatea TaxID=43366 RepID=A0AAN9J7T4_CLITE